MRHISRVFAMLMVSSVCLLSGCLESSFTLSNDSRLPVWVKLPPKVQRQDVSLTLNYYSYPFGANAKFILRNRHGDILEEVSGIEKPINDVSEYPGFVLIKVNGVPEVIEHRTKGPIFYISDDPVIRNKALTAK